MLAGEYAVLKGSHALAATLACGMIISVEWDPHAARWEIHSNIWSDPKFVSDDHSPQSDMLCRAVQYMAKKTGMHGGKVRVDSAIEIEHGIGSSSAIRLGICSAFYAIKNGLDQSRSHGLSIEAMNAAWSLQSEGQGVASGYDIATQFVGGLVEFKFEYDNNHWKPKWFKHDLDALNEIVHVFVGGAGAPTTETVQTMSSWIDGGNRYDRLVEVSETLIDAFNEAIQWPSKRSLSRLATLCGSSRNFFATGPCFPTTIATQLASIPGLDKTWSWKTTGAGGEDAIIVVGEKKDIQSAVSTLWENGWHRLEHKFSSVGAHVISFHDDTTTPTPTYDAFNQFTAPRMKGYLR